MIMRNEDTEPECHLVGGVEHLQALVIRLAVAGEARVTAGFRPIHIHTQVAENKYIYIKKLDTLYLLFHFSDNVLPSTATVAI